MAEGRRALRPREVRLEGTLTPDGKTVTSAGKVKTCMGCHTENTTDRMFGL